jgi:hypothetical protein
VVFGGFMINQSISMLSSEGFQTNSLKNKIQVDIPNISDKRGSAGDSRASTKR